MIRSSGRPYVSKYCKFQWIAGGSGGGGGGGWGGGYTRGEGVCSMRGYTLWLKNWQRKLQ